MLVKRYPRTRPMCYSFTHVQVLYGNCVVISLDFWFQPLVGASVRLACFH